jgi:DNA repair exonuclease SbcCD ATPase subunit
MADHLAIGILVGMAFGIAALLVIAAVTLRRSDVSQSTEGLRVHRALADLQRIVRQEAGALRRDVETSAQAARDDGARSVQMLRDEIAGRLQATGDDLAGRLGGLTDAAVNALREHPMPALARLIEAQERQLGALAAELTHLAAALESRLDQVESRLDERLRDIQAATREGLDHLRAEAVGHANDLSNKTLELLKAHTDTAGAWMGAIADGQRRQLDELQGQHAAELERISAAVDTRLEHLRAAAEDTLGRTVETRFGERFGLVSEQLDQVSARLEEVHRGLDDVQSFAAGLGHLQRAVATVRLGGPKTRDDKGAAPAGVSEGGPRGRASRRKAAPSETSQPADP